MENTHCIQPSYHWCAVRVNQSLWKIEVTCFYTLMLNVLFWPNHRFALQLSFHENINQHEHNFISLISHRDCLIWCICKVLSVVDFINDALWECERKRKLTWKWKAFNLISHQVNKQRSTMFQQWDKLHSTGGVFPIRAHYGSLLFPLTLTLEMLQDSAEVEEAERRITFFFFFRLNSSIK